MAWWIRPVLRQRARGLGAGDTPLAAYGSAVALINRACWLAEGGRPWVWGPESWLRSAASLIASPLLLESVPGYGPSFCLAGESLDRARCEAFPGGSWLAASWGLTRLGLQRGQRAWVERGPCSFCLDRSAAM